MASVKKTMKSSETKQAKQPRTRNPKAKASKRAAEAKARQAAAARVLAAKKLAAKKLATKQLAAKKLASKKPAIKKPATKKLATKKSVQKVKTKTTVKTKTKTAAAVNSRATSTAAKTKAPASTRASASRSSTTSAAKKTAAAARRGKLTLARAPTAKRAVATKPVEAVRLAATGKPARGKQAAAPKNTPALKVSPRKAVKPATAARKTVESETHAAQNLAAGKGAAAALLAAFKRNVARLSEVRKQAASAAPSVRPAVNPSNLSLESNERMAVIKESEKKKSLGTASGQAGKNAARQLAKDAATGETAGAGKSLDMKAATKLLVSKAAPPIENRPVALAPVVIDAAQSNIGEAKVGERPSALVAKPAKTGSSQRQSFRPGEFVVYPAHGVGQIVAVEEQEVAGFKLELFVISFIKDKMILKVPTPKVVSVGMRKLADASAVKTALDTLAGRARVKRTMWSRRAQEYEAKINSGDLNAIAEVVRDLYRSDTQPEQSYSERQLYEAALDRMTREIVVVQKLTETESLKVIEAQLQKGPRRGKAEEIDAEEAEIEEAA
ncbi:MAG: CarD family transcriptional regulator [Methylocella sp.]